VILFKVFCLYIGGISLYYGAKLFWILWRHHRIMKGLDRKIEVLERRSTFKLIKGEKDADGIQSSATEERSQHP
jgi:hypothetical protein